MSFPKWALISRRPLLLGLAVAASAMALLWLLVVDGGRDGQRPGGPEIVAASDLSGAAERLGHPIYWAGERARTRLELTESDSGGVYVRYLDEDGARGSGSMTVATYPVADAAAALRRGAKERPRAELARGDDGALVLIDPDTPGSVHLAHPGSDHQVELYTPDVELGIRLATHGGVRPAR